MSVRKSKAERDAEREHATDVLRRDLKRDSRLFTLTEYGKGETDYVRVFHAPARGEVFELTYHIGRACGFRLTERGIALRGGGYSKALEVADSAWRQVFGAAIPQTDNWSRL